MSQWFGKKVSTPKTIDEKTLDANWDRMFDKTDDVLDVYNDERLVSKFDKQSKISVDKNKENK
jgi:hypothetical protein